ncbi:sporulation protein Cse60 [Streptococcus thermophilus]|uniref:sporulation protein Cse60 n=1 Tax=Streptococcus thermophilus TaxID=1308 RepID=UPI0022EB93F8|nr:sporulation protein Cse60 [Streptococcus thermophilus]MDA3774867.1 sporulation protein Cse60 [Streptococcus thermophilus]
MGIKIREFWTDNRYGYGIDDEINDFVKEKHNVELIDIEIIDIKYQTIAHEKDGKCIIRTSALIMYKEKQAFQRW